MAGRLSDAQEMMMSELIRYDLGLEGLEYVSSQLAAGLTFSKCVLDSVDVHAGEVFTYLPPGVPAETLVEFRFGGKLPTPPESTWVRIEWGTAVPIPSTLPALVDLVETVLQGKGRLGVLENFNASRTDPWLTKSTVNASFFENEVYHLLKPGFSRSEIEKAIRNAESSLVVFMGAVTLLPERHSIPEDRAELSLALLQDLAAKVDFLFFGAYDGEGYVCWRRRS